MKVMGIFGFFKAMSASKREALRPPKDQETQDKESGYADSSGITADERPFYREDSYYTLYSYPGTPMARKVITFEERKRTACPSTNGLYPAEILLLSYCDKGKYPKPKAGYPGFWWFEYGVRDVGHALDSLVTKGFIEWAPKIAGLKGLKVEQLKNILRSCGLSASGKKADLIERIIDNVPEKKIVIADYIPKYQLTTLGREELLRNGYVPYMHAHKLKTREGVRFGEAFNVWTVNQCFRNDDARDWRKIVGAIELRMFGRDYANADPVESPALNSSDIARYLHSKKKFISDRINGSGDGFEEEMKGIELKAAGRDDEALVNFYIAIGKKFDAPALYREAAVILRKYRMYAQEVEVLAAGLKNISKSNARHRKELKVRLDKARMLASRGDKSAGSHSG